MQPHEVSIENLDATHYSDYILLRGVRLAEDYDGLWAISDNKRIRIWQKFNIDGLFYPDSGSLDGHSFDIEGIYGTDELYGDIIEEIYLMGIEDKTGSNPSGIHDVTIYNYNCTRTYYNMQGQRVRPTTKGLLIIDGKKLIKR